MDSRDTLPWVEKYRPNDVASVLGHEETIMTIRRLLKRGELPHLLLHGPPGTGKTSLIQALARTLHGPRLRHMVLELNASDDRGIAVVRNQIKTFAESQAPVFNASELGSTVSSIKDENIPKSNAIKAQPSLDFYFAASKQKVEECKVEISVSPSEVKTDAASSFAGFDGDSVEVHERLRSLKLVILDEVDQMTAAAQTALRRIMEKHAAHVRFFLMCNDVGKINPPIQSRCTKFRFAPLPDTFIRDKLQDVIKQENCKVSPAAVEELVKRAGGDFRRLLNTLQASSLSCGDDIIQQEDILTTLGLPNANEIDEVFQALCTLSFKQAFGVIREAMKGRGIAMSDLLNAVYERCVALEWPGRSIRALLPRIAEIESSLAVGANDYIQAAALVAAFIEVREDLAGQKTGLTIASLPCIDVTM